MVFTQHRKVTLQMPGPHYSVGKYKQDDKSLSCEELTRWNKYEIIQPYVTGFLPNN